MKTKFLSLIGCMALLGGATQAGATTYTVNETIEAGTITGSITTDGTIGVLHTSDISSWSLIISEIAPATINSTDAGAKLTINGNDLTADANYIYFNFADTSSTSFTFTDPLTQARFGGRSAGLNEAESSCVGACGPYEGDLFFWNYNDTYSAAHYFSSQAPIADASGLYAGTCDVSTSVVCVTPDPFATPLPAALPLFASGLGALGLLGWRRKRKNAAAFCSRLI